MYRFFLLLVAFSVNNAFGQDVIQKQNGNKIDVTIISSNLSSISYRLSNSNDTVIYTIPKVELKRITYANGNTEVFVKTKVTSKLQKNISKGYGLSIIKINPLSPLFGHTQLSYEHQIDKSNSIEYFVSFIGAGLGSRGPSSFRMNNGSDLRVYKNQAGLSLGIGYKLYITNQDNRINKLNSLASGFYIKPSVYLGGFQYNSYDVKNSALIMQEQSSVFGAIVLEPGFQFLVTKNLTVDFYAGLGYVFDDSDYDKLAYLDDGFGYGGAIGIGYSYMYSALRLSENSPGLAMTGGVKLGWTINKKSPSKKK